MLYQAFHNLIQFLVRNLLPEPSLLPAISMGTVPRYGRKSPLANPEM